VVTPDGFLSAALRYAEMGYRVFPCVPGDKTPLTAHGFHDATTDPGQIERWWAQHPRANVGIATKGLLVLDIDGSDNPWPGDPERSVELATAPLALTANGGSHRLFRQPAGRNWRCTESRLAPKVDTRANGGYIVAPPSVLGPERNYRWAPGCELDDPPERLPEPPPWLAGLLDGLAAPSPTIAHVATSPAEGNAIPEGQRNATLAKLGGAMRRVGMSEAEILAALNRVNADRCRPARWSGSRRASPGTSPTRCRSRWSRTTSPRCSTRRPERHRPIRPIRVRSPTSCSACPASSTR
jgi:hypothetical protein